MSGCYVIDQFGNEFFGPCASKQQEENVAKNMPGSSVVFKG